MYKPLLGLVFATARLCQELQLLLEKDLGHNWWYCHTCSVLHAISAQGLTGSGSRRPLGEPDSSHDSLFLCGSGFGIGYQTMRLAMNRLVSKRQCGYNLLLVRYYPYVPSSSPSGGAAVARKIPHSHKVERLVHLELAGRGLCVADRERWKCEACGREHKEWFEVEASRPPSPMWTRW
ncbi:meiotically up-regulated gene 113-domain-containing protein [Staphylotrichum tortipilum]|uniref:Meiotically up-regulated gene 113-domain-containing protein n=1 Tax=Staphylotrichum tortipilum TaxID=2831512 RepID=A0AAN6RMW4_9PEZI|nr:meiotically up-regulated gene 113-domain-containing protein [Staphylotrichum longicolle]